MSLRKRYLPVVALLGAGLAVIPAMATSAPSSTATVSGIETDMWSPMEVAITPGGTVTFQNTSSSVPHGVVWKSGPEIPACTGVPINEGATDWQGSCTFSKEGTYDYYCYIHGMKMAGSIYVNAAGTVPAPTTPSTTTPSTTPTTTMGTMPMGTSPPTGAGPAGEGGSVGPLDSLSGSSVRLSSRQRGERIRGSVGVAQGGSKLTVEVLAATAQLAEARRSQTRVGRLVRASLPVGRASFSVALDARARRALHQRRRLTVSVRLALIAPGGMVSTRATPVVLRQH